MNNFQKKYLDEVGHRLCRKGFTALPKDAGLLQVEKAGVLLCHVNMHSGMCYDADFVRRNGLKDALDQVRSIAVETQAYMRQMAAAPPLLAEGLSGDYRLLAEFNHIVLAGHEREGSYGVEFITWERWHGSVAGTLLRQRLCRRQTGFCHPLRPAARQPPLHTRAAGGNL